MLGLSPVRDGFGWVVVEFDEVLLDWGCVRGLAPLERLLEQYAPSDARVSETARTWAAVERIQARYVDVIFVSDEAIDLEFSGCGARTERERVVAISNQFPALKEQAPSFGSWKRETERQAVFRALAVVLAGSAT